MERSTRKYKATKLPVEVFDEAELVKAKLIMNREALKKLPSEGANPAKCPLGGNDLRVAEVKVAVKMVSCQRCGYKQPSLDVSSIGNDPAAIAGALGLGVLAGLGIAALLYLIFSGEKNERS